MKKLLILSGYTALVLLLSACGRLSGGGDTSAEEAVTVGVGAFSSAVNMQNSSSVLSRSFHENTPISTRFANLLLGEMAHATVASCAIPAVSDACDSSTKTKSANYTACPIGSSGLQYSGNVTLTYSRTSCLLLAADDSVTRTVNFTRQGAAGSTVTTSSDSHSDYRGNTVRGGMKLTKISGGYQMNVLGLHKVQTSSAGAKLFDISLRTTTPFNVTDISQSSLTVSSGSLEVIHNVAAYTATFTSSNLVYNQASCCYPTSGTLSVNYSGSITGSASVTFGSCGTVTYTRGGSSKSLTLAGCE